MAEMHVSKGFLQLLEHQLGQFADRPEVQGLVVYLAAPANGRKPQLIPVGRWPSQPLALPPVEEDPDLRIPSEGRRWLPLQQGTLLLGALRVESGNQGWSESLHRRLQHTALCLTEALCLDLEQQRLRQQLQLQESQLQLLVHQLRNPLAALRTFAQLLLRRLDGDSEHRALVQSLLSEQHQIDRYVEAISALSSPAALAPAAADQPPLRLPPALKGAEPLALQQVLPPLLERAAATAALQGRPWHGPPQIPSWGGDAGPVAEIVANLLENAFRYSPQGRPVGLHCRQLESPPMLELCVWDGGEPIGAAEGMRIFERGIRGSRGEALPGSGLGLALARDLAHSLKGDLVLFDSPGELAADLPDQGNAFCLRLPLPEPLAEPSAEQGDQQEAQHLAPLHTGAVTVAAVAPQPAAKPEGHEQRRHGSHQTAQGPLQQQ